LRQRLGVPVLGAAADHGRLRQAPAGPDRAGPALGADQRHRPPDPERHRAVLDRAPGERPAAAADRLLISAPTVISRLSPTRIAPAVNARCIPVINTGTATA